MDKNKSLEGNCEICGKVIPNKNDVACKQCQEECENEGHGGAEHKHIAQIMFGCFCTRCGKSWFDF